MSYPVAAEQFLREAQKRARCVEGAAQRELRVSFDQDTEGSAPDIVRYDWDFDDGNTLPDGGAMVNHTFSMPGTFDVSVTVTDNESAPNTQTDTDVLTVTVLAADDPACNTPPTIQCPTVTQTASVGVLFSFGVSASDVDAGDVVTLDVQNLPAGAQMSPVLPALGNPVSSTFEWTPTNADQGTHVVTFTATDLAGREASCQVTIEVAECYLALGRGLGSETFNAGGHVFTTQLAEITAVYPVTMVEGPEFLLGPALPAGLQAHGPVAQHRTRFGAGTPVLPAPSLGELFTAQVVMWNPPIFPGNPEQWSQGVFVSIEPFGSRVVSRSYGTENGIQLEASTYEAGGQRWLRFPFSIDGM